jgi:hypothetical protein
LGNFKTDGSGNATGSVEDKLIKLIGPESVIGVCTSCRELDVDYAKPWYSAPLSFTPVSMISASPTTQSQRRLVMQELDQHAVWVSQIRLLTILTRLGVIGIAA